MKRYDILIKLISLQQLPLEQTFAQEIAFEKVTNL